MLTRVFFKQPSKAGSVLCPLNRFARREYTSTPKIIHYDDIQQLIKSDTQVNNLCTYNMAQTFICENRIIFYLT